MQNKCKRHEESKLAKNLLKKLDQYTVTDSGFPVESSTSLRWGRFENVYVKGRILDPYGRMQVVPMDSPMQCV